MLIIAPVLAALATAFAWPLPLVAVRRNWDFLIPAEAKGLLFSV
jgi:hypothetical protein